MKRKAFLPFLLCLVFLAACGSPSAPAAAETGAPWPSHAPETTPYVRLQTEPAAAPPSEAEREEGEHYDSWEELIQSMYTAEGDFYGIDWEMQMFRELPQDEPFAFVVHTAAMLQGADSLEDHIALAQKFIDLGCEAKVKEMYSVEQGQVYTGWATVIITTPAHMWEISESLGEQIFLEQLYESVDIRFDKVVWPET